MKKYITIAITILVVSIISYQLMATSVNTETIKIGYIAPLSGNLAFLGEGVRNAAMLKLEDLNKQNTKYKYELIFEDDAFDPKKTASAANKLISIDKVDAIVTVASAAGNIVNPIAEKAKIVHFGIASDPNIAKGQYNFINWTPPREEVKLFISEAQKRGIKRIAVFGQQISGIVAVVDELKKQTAGTNITVVSEDISNFGTKDFRQSISKAKLSMPDYYLLVMFSPELEILVKQMKEMDVEQPITAIESFELSDNPALFEGLWYINGADPTEQFYKEYSERYSKNPTIATPNAYDILGLISTAVERFDKRPSTAEIAHSLIQIKNYDGSMGNNLSIDSDGLVVSKAVTRIIKNGKPETIK